MASPPQINIVASKRVPFDDTIPMMGVDYSGATPLMEIRPEPGGTGDPLVSLEASVAGGEGIVVSWDADFPDPDGIMADGATIVRVIINETTLEGLAYNAPPESDLTLYYDIHLTPVDGKKFVYCSGTFTVSPGVTL
jgi:hypothetical protein